MPPPIGSHRQLLVWQKAVDLVEAIYELTEQFPASETYGLVAQMRRAAVSVPSNSAEGRRRGTRKEYRQFLLVAAGSAAELETQLEIVKRLPFGKRLDTASCESLLEEVAKMLSAMINSLSFPISIRRLVPRPSSRP